MAVTFHNSRLVNVTLSFICVLNIYIFYLLILKYFLARMRMFLEKSDYPEDSTIQSNKFAINDFIVGTATTIFATVTVKGSKIKVIIFANSCTWCLSVLFDLGYFPRTWSICVFSSCSPDSVSFTDFCFPVLLCCMCWKTIHSNKTFDFLNTRLKNIPYPCTVFRNNDQFWFYNLK